MKSTNGTLATGVSARVGQQREQQLSGEVVFVEVVERQGPRSLQRCELVGDGPSEHIRAEQISRREPRGSERPVAHGDDLVTFGRLSPGEQGSSRQPTRRPIANEYGPRRPTRLERRPDLQPPQTSIDRHIEFGVQHSDVSAQVRQGAIAVDD